MTDNNLHYFVSLRMEGKFPSGFDADTWEITEELYFEIFEMVRISSRAKNTTGVFP